MIMDIEELDSVDEAAERSYIYSDVLYHKVNSKLKQLKVVLRRGITGDGSQVFHLDIQGVRHHYHFQLDFTPRELCFLRFEEFQDFVRDSSCWSCINRNYYPPVVYSRILLVLYLDSGKEGEEAKCIKVPFIQRGNVNSVTRLRKLQETIFHNIVSADELKHWLVHVVRCGDRTPGDRVFLCLTKYAFVVVHNYTICHYHAFQSSDISIQCHSERKEVELIVNDKTLTNWSEGTENFSLHKVYTFQTAQVDHIERSFKSLLRQSQFLPKSAPRAHYNIRQSDASAALQLGTTSDNVMIVPHKPEWHDNNNSGSGSANVASDKISNLNETPVPNAHTSLGHINHGFHSTSSNGSIPNHSADIFSTHKEVARFSDLPLNPRGAREKWPDDESVGDMNDSLNQNLIEVDVINESTHVKGIADVFVESHHLLPPDSDPMHGHTDRLTSHKKKSSLPNLENLFMDDIDHAEFVTDTEACELPPPPPCSSVSQPFAKFPADYLTPDQHFQSVPMKPVVPRRFPKVQLRRSQSYLDLKKQEFMEHFYVNIAQEMCSRGSVHDDSPYYRFYYNIGLIRSMFSRISQRKKIDRVNRLSKELKEVNMNELTSHEQWYDRDFQDRTRDSKFCSIYNIRPELSTESDYSRVEEDDPYWTQNELCVTIQRLLEEDPKAHTLFTEVQRAFDLTAEQLMEVQILLSLVPAVNDWKNLAEFIGLTFGDINIIEHFCYTYRKLTTHVVLVHWLFKDHKNESIRPCNRESLLQFLIDSGRGDISLILRSRSENEHMQNEDEIIASTHF